MQLCGDAHLSNFGTFAAPDRRLVFSLNDFDETLPGPFEWDVKRLVASFAVAGRDRGFDDAAARGRQPRGRQRRTATAMRDLAGMRKLDIWYARLDVDELEAVLRPQLKSRQLKRFRKNVAKARAKDSMRAFAKLVEVVDGRPRLISDPPVLVRLEELLPDRQHHERRERPARHPAFLPAHPVGRSSAPAGGLPLRRRGPQGRRGRERRHPRVDRADGRPRRQRPAVPPGQGGPDLGPGALPGQERPRQPRSAGRRGSATHAVGQRHHARLGPHRPASTGWNGTSTSVRCGTARDRRSSRR